MNDLDILSRLKMSWKVYGMGYNKFLVLQNLSIQENYLEAKAHLRYVRISPRKARLVVDMIRGMDTTQAKAVLNFVPKKAAGIVKKLLDSAISNAVENHGMKEENLYISKIYIDQGPTLKRWRPRARGRADRILKRTSHITIYVSQREGS